MKLGLVRLPHRPRAFNFPIQPFLAAVLCVSGQAMAQTAQQPTPAPIVITGADMRQATSLNGDWATIVDPYANGFYSYFRNQVTEPGDNKLVDITSPSHHD